MIPVLVLTHGELATELLDAARTIDPHLNDGAEALALPWDVDSDHASKDLRQRLADLDQGEGVLILTDMFGGTATNLALPLLDPDRVEIVTGVNLPMLVKLGSLRGAKRAR
jgi:PTS system mannose-specific IIA component